LAALLLSACDLNLSPAPTGPPNESTGTPVPAVATAIAAPSPTPLPPIRQVLRLHIVAEPDVIDPQLVEAQAEIDVALKVFANLLAFDALGNLVPDMALEVPKASADGLTYTVKLKPGLKYSDGRA